MEGGLIEEYENCGGTRKEGCGRLDGSVERTILSIEIRSRAFAA